MSRKWILVGRDCLVQPTELVDHVRYSVLTLTLSTRHTLVQIVDESSTRAADFTADPRDCVVRRLCARLPHGYLLFLAWGQLGIAARFAVDVHLLLVVVGVERSGLECVLVSDVDLDSTHGAFHALDMDELVVVSVVVCVLELEHERFGVERLSAHAAAKTVGDVVVGAVEVTVFVANRQAANKYTLIFSH